MISGSVLLLFLVLTSGGGRGDGTGRRRQEAEEEGSEAWMRHGERVVGRFLTSSRPKSGGNDRRLKSGEGDAPLSDERA